MNQSSIIEIVKKIAVIYCSIRSSVLFIRMLLFIVGLFIPSGLSIIFLLYFIELRICICFLFVGIAYSQWKQDWSNAMYYPDNTLNI